MVYQKLKIKKAFSLVEIVVAMALFTLIFSSVAFFSADAFRFSKNNRTRINASLQIMQLSSAIKQVKGELWKNIVDNTDSGDKTISFANGVYSITNGQSITDNITTYFTVGRVYRDSSLNIVATGGTEDIHSRSINIYARWADLNGTIKTISNTLYLNNWNTSTWKISSNAEFLTGTFQSTVATNTGGGEVELDRVFISDWCKPELNTSSYNLPGTGIPSLISSIPGKAFLGSTSYTLQNLVINHNVEPPSVNVEGSFSGYSTTAIFGDASYTYLATTNDNKEVVIVNTSTAPYSEVGNFNASGTTDASSIYVSGNVGFVAQGRTLRSFNLTSKTGSRPQLGSLNVGGLGGTYFVGEISEIEIRGNYAFLSMYNDWYELIIVNISNPSAMTVVKNVELNYSQSSDLYVSDDGNRVFIGTTSSSSYDEFFILDTTNKSGSIPILDSYDTGGMSVLGNTVVDDRAVIVGSGGEEYQVLNISNINNVFKCGGLNINSGLTGVTSVLVGDQRYSYVIGNDTAAEFRIIEGGLGNQQGYEFLQTGTYTSQILDTGTSNSSYYSIEWTGTIPTGANLRAQIRTGNQANLSDGTWYGPDGTGATYFTLQNGSYIPYAQSNGKRYAQIRFYFDSDKINTAILQDFKLTYQK